MSKVKVMSGKGTLTPSTVKMEKNKTVSVPKGELKRKQCNGMGAAVKGGSYLGV